MTKRPIKRKRRMTERTFDFALLVSSELEELSQRLTMEGVEHDKDFLFATAKYLEEI